MGVKKLTMTDQDAKKLQWILLLIVSVAVIGALLGVPQWLTDGIIQWLINAFIGTVFSVIAASFVEAFTGDFLKTILITVEMYGIKFSISLFTIATIMVKLMLFPS